MKTADEIINEYGDILEIEIMQLLQAERKRTLEEAAKIVIKNIHMTRKEMAAYILELMG